jgi:hypothetical protein
MQSRAQECVASLAIEAFHMLDRPRAAGIGARKVWGDDTIRVR